MIDKMEVGKKIFTLRKSMGITQDSLAKIISVTPQAISKWEKGAALPDTCLLPTLSKLFQVSIEEILCTNSNNSLNIQKRDNNQVMLPNLIYYQGTPSLVSCIRSSLNYLGIHVSLGWISAPYAFMLNINDKVSFKGPEYWSDNGCFDELIRNCGGIHDYLSSCKSDVDISKKRIEAWNIIRDAINKGLPCYAWEMEKPQYYLIAGYDETGYYYIDPDSMNIAGPKPYKEIGESQWGILEVHIIRPGTISDNLKTIKDIFEYAINVSNPDMYPPNQGYTMGAAAYKTWWEALCKGTADYYGVAYNASFWSKCKKLAAIFLREAQLRVDMMEDSFNRAISNYEAAAKSLTYLSQLFPLKAAADCIICEQSKHKAVNLLKAAQKSEMHGLEEINNILNGIYKIW